MKKLKMTKIKQREHFQNCVHTFCLLMPVGDFSTQNIGQQVTNEFRALLSHVHLLSKVKQLSVRKCTKSSRHLPVYSCCNMPQTLGCHERFSRVCSSDRL